MRTTFPMNRKLENYPFYRRYGGALLHTSTDVLYLDPID